MSQVFHRAYSSKENCYLSEVQAELGVLRFFFLTTLAWGQFHCPLLAKAGTGHSRPWVWGPVEPMLSQEKRQQVCVLPGTTFNTVVLGLAPALGPRDHAMLSTLFLNGSRGLVTSTTLVLQAAGHRAGRVDLGENPMYLR